MVKKPYLIREYQSFTCKEGNFGPAYEFMDQKTFDNLENFILANHSIEDSEPLELMVISSRRGMGKIISAKNYVGLITMKDSTEIEILPKIYAAENDHTREIFLEMLKTVKDVPYKKLNVSSLNTERMNIFEVFIRMFIDEVYPLVRKGLKSTYNSFSNNESFFKGKMITSEHIKRNYAHKERVYVQYDIYSTDRPENRLIKSTINYLWKNTSNPNNKKDLNILLSHFESVNFSTDYRHDFSKYTKNRNLTDYDIIMQWCRVFLFNESFSNFAGSEVAYALLFPMEYVFESYIAHMLRRQLDRKRFAVKIQDSGFYLFDKPRKFVLRPDIVVEDKESGAITILDTKWKLLSVKKSNMGISQSDMYQMYAYQKKYNAEKVILIYPLNEMVLDKRDGAEYRADDGVVVKVEFVDLLYKDLRMICEEIQISVKYPVT